MKDRIKKIRVDKGLTQEQFASSLKTSRSNIAGYETGTRCPSDAVISLICRVFNVSETWLLTGEGEAYIEMSREDELMEWVGQTLGSESETFQKRFVRMLSKLSVLSKMRHLHSVESDQFIMHLFHH